jgi:hypothetical protein
MNCDPRPENAVDEVPVSSNTLPLASVLTTLPMNFAPGAATSVPALAKNTASPFGPLRAFAPP